MLDLFAAIQKGIKFASEPNFACTGRGGYCSDSDTCASLGGEMEKLSVRCKWGNACCKCTDKCPDGSTCMSEGETCDGMKDTNGCCGNRFCCTPTTTTPPEPCEQNCFGECKDQCDFQNEERSGDCCGLKCCGLVELCELKKKPKDMSFVDTTYLSRIKFKLFRSC
ncbi:unnamed protein product [Mytilus coruscus]|uniref:Uncharacterized protein n=1 Tax=Mytilus coruscus TaxID=42192 RepID=A0A6J8BB53_MYTCO|nr:unnamed protein product [Mytilus coruscus]